MSKALLFPLSSLRSFSSVSLSLFLLFLVLSVRFFSFDTEASTHAREDCVLMSVQLQCCALCRLSCGVEVLLAFLSYWFK